MSVSLNDWTEAKGLLVMLAQALAGKTDEAPLLFGSGGPSFLALRIFSKRLDVSRERFNHEVRLLPTLKMAQKQMERWVEILPSDRERTANQSFLPNETRSAKLLQTKQEMPRTYSDPLVKRESSAERLPSKAQRLVEEVRIAIQTLSTSSFLSNPQSAHLRSALSKLKPLIDDFIDAVSKNSLDFNQDSLFTQSQEQAVNSTKRKKGKTTLIPFSLIEKSREPGVNTPSIHQIEKKNSTEEPKSSKKTILDLAKKEFLSRCESKERKQPPDSAETNLDKSRSGSSDFFMISNSVEEKERPVHESHSLPQCIPAAPPVVNRPSQEVYKKKKGRRYFFKDEEEDDKDLLRE